jgi:hypothetical protein
LTSAGISAAHVAILDPNPLVNGRGVQRLEDNGISVVLGEGACEAGELIEAHARHVTTGLPFVTLLLDPPPAGAASLLAMTDAVLTDLSPPHPSLHPVVVTVPESGEERVDYDSVLRDLGQQGITSCAITGTPSLSRSLLQQKTVDKIVSGVAEAGPVGFTLRRTEADPAPHAIFYPASRAQ